MMMDSLTNIFHWAGIIGFCAAGLATVAAIVYLSISGVRLRVKLEQEYGIRRSNK